MDRAEVGVVHCVGARAAVEDVVARAALHYVRVRVAVECVGRARAAHVAHVQQQVQVGRAVRIRVVGDRLGRRAGYAEVNVDCRAEALVAHVPHLVEDLGDCLG